MTLKTRLHSYLTTYPGPKAKRYINLRDPVLWDDILQATDFLPIEIGSGQRCWHVENDVWAVPTCKITGAEVNWSAGRYMTYADRSAKNLDPESVQKRTETQRRNKEAKIGRPMSERKKYRMEVMRHTKRNWRHHKEKINGWERRGSEFHLDHIYSISDGFSNKVDPAVIGHWSNFRILPARQNLNKHTNSAIGLEQLLHTYEMQKK